MKLFYKKPTTTTATTTKKQIDQMETKKKQQTNIILRNFKDKPLNLIENEIKSPTSTTINVG